MPTRVQVPGHGIVEFPDGMSQDAMKDAILSLDPPKDTPSKWGWYQGIVNALPSSSTVAKALPAVGGAIGGMIGGPAGAAVGGAAGQGYKTLVQNAAEIPGAMRDVARNAMQYPSETAEGAVSGVNRGGLDTGLQAAAQGGLQKAGDVASTVATSKVAPWLMDKALNLSDKLSREFPNLSQTMIENALTVTQGGLNQARKMLRAAKDQANGALATAERAGAAVPITAATDGLNTTLQKVVNSSDPEGGLRALIAAERKITTGRSPTLSPTEADALKVSLQTQSKALYAAEKAGTGRPNTTIHAQALADMAASLNQALGNITTQAGAPGYRDANAGAQEMIGAVRGIAKGMKGNDIISAARKGPSAALGATVTTPAMLSNFGLMASKPSMQALLKQSPRISALVLQMLSPSSQ